MRFDDRLETVSQIDPTHPSGRAAIWHQLVDMLAQSGADISMADAEKSLAALALVRPHVPVAVRARSVATAARRCQFAPLIAFLANDHPQVAVAAVDNAALSGGEWLAVMPDLGPVGRSRLRKRDNLPPEVAHALMQFGPTDFALAAPETVSANDEGTSSIDSLQHAPSHDIAELVRRIDRYRARRETTDPAVHALRCDADGQVRAVSALPRALFVGVSLNEAARPTEPGCDAGVARAFAKRAPIRDGRLFVAGDADDGGGLWLLDADALFDRESGRFSGYSGTVRRAGLVSTAPPARSRQAVVDGTADGMRQLVHELRSPLNAISGFSQLIQGQYFGPVSAPYRSIAAGIVQDAHHLTIALEDIDLAARLDAGAWQGVPGQCDARAIVSAAAALRGWPRPTAHHALARGGADTPMCIDIATSSFDQLIQRLMRAIEQLTPDSPRPHITVSQAPNEASVSIHFPCAATLPTQPQMPNAGEAELNQGVFDPGFGLRLTGRLTERLGGTLVMDQNTCILNFPLVTESSERIDAAV